MPVAPDRPLSPTLAVALARLLADLAADRWEREERFRRRILSELAAQDRWSHARSSREGHHLS
jgi:hypothetical protein